MPRWCLAAEGNTTFYGLPGPVHRRPLVRAMPRPTSGSCSSCRGAVTHDRRLRNASAEVSDFLERLVRTRSGSGPPPTRSSSPRRFGPDDLGVLDRFLGGLSAEHRWAVEVRHPALADGGDDERRLNDLLASQRRRADRDRHPGGLRRALGITRGRAGGGRAQAPPDRPSGGHRRPAAGPLHRADRPRGQPRRGGRSGCPRWPSGSGRGPLAASSSSTRRTIWWPRRWPGGSTPRWRRSYPNLSPPLDPTRSGRPSQLKLL